MANLRHSGSRGFTMIEMIMVTAIIGILAAVVVSVVASGTLQGAREVRSSQDEKVLNSAVLAYLASGGDLSSAKGGEAVLAKLKTSVSEDQRKRTPGLSGSFLDSSVEFVMQTEEEAKKELPRLLWSPSKNRFEVARSGPPGIVSIARRGDSSESDGTPSLHGPSGSAGDGATEDRETPFSYAAKDTWIWDYAEAPATTGPGISDFGTSDPTNATPPSTVAPIPPSILPPTPPVVPPVTSPPVTKRVPLLAPQFSRPGGRFARSDFNLSVSLRDPNPAGSAALFYALNHGAWTPYSGGSISIPSDTSLKAQAMPLNAETHDPSAVVETFYEAFDPFNAMLLPPGIDFTKEYFQNSSDSITVRLTNPNKEGVSEIQYQLLPVPGGQGPTLAYSTYSGPFVVSAGSYPSGFGIRAYAKATASGYVDSRPATRFATAQKTLFGGHLDLDTSIAIAKVGSGTTGAHSHDILKAGGTSLNFFALPEGKQIEIQEAIRSGAQAFKLTVVNGALSPGMNLTIDYDFNGSRRTIDMPVDAYGKLKVSDLPAFSLVSSAGTAKLTGLRLSMAQDLIYQAGVIPTTTGEVVSNVPGKDGEWRNGALTLQAVAVNADGSPAHSLDSSKSNGSHGAATSGMLWEAAVFWHWPGESYKSNKNTFKPGNFNSIRLFVWNTGQTGNGKSKGK